MQLLGSRFVAHPPHQAFTVRVSGVQHPLTAGLIDFDVEEEEPYYCEKLGEQLVLLEASYNAPSTSYVQSGVWAPIETPIRRCICIPPVKVRCCIYLWAIAQVNMT